MHDRILFFLALCSSVRRCNMPFERLSFVKTLLKSGIIQATDPLLQNKTKIVCLRQTLCIWNEDGDPNLFCISGTSNSLSDCSTNFKKIYRKENFRANVLNDWSRGEQWILFPSNFNVSLDFVSGNIEILGRQNSLFPSGPVIKWLLSLRSKT